MTCVSFRTTNTMVRIDARGKLLVAVACLLKAVLLGLFGWLWGPVGEACLYTFDVVPVILDLLDQVR
jgi:hypothetical protein